MAYDLGTTRGQVEIGYNPKGVTAAEKDLTGLEKKSSSVNRSFNTLAKGMALAGAGIAAGIAVAVKSATSFEQRLSGIKAVSGATVADMEAVRAKALQLGRDTKFSANDAATAIEELAKAGISLPDIMNGAADATVALAAAGEVELPRAAEIAANAMNVFSLKAQDMPKVADLIAGAANASAISVEEFAQSLQQSGAAAALVGVDFEDLTTSIALMGNAGIKGSDAGTSLKTFLQNLQPDTVKQTKLFKKLGLITKEGGNAFFDAAGKIKPMAEVAQVLQDSLKGMTDQQKQATLNTLFGSDAIRAAAIIAKGGAKGFDTLAGSIGKVTAQDVAKTRMDNLAGSIEQLKGSAETAAIGLGTILIPQIRAMVDHLTGLINAFSGLDPSTQALIINIAKVAAVLLLFGAATIKTVMFVSKLAESFTLIGKGIAVLSKMAIIGPILTSIGTAARVMWAALLGPVGLIIAGILLLVAGIILLYKHNETFRKAVQAVWGWLKTNIPPIAQAIANAVVTAWQWLVSATQTAFSSIVTIIRTVWTSIVTAFNVGRAAVMVAWNAIWLVLGPVVTTAFAIISGVIRVGMAVIGAAVTAGMAVVRAGFAVFSTVLGIVLPVLNIIRLAFVLVFNVIKLLVLVVFVGIYLAVRTYLTLMAATVTSGLNTIRAIFSTVFNAIRAVVSLAMTVIRTVVSAGMNAVRAVFSAGMAVVRAVMSAGMAAVRAVFTSAMNALRAVANAVMGSAIGAAARRGAAAVIAGIQTIGRIVGIVAGFMARVVAAIASGAGRAVGAIASMGSRIVGAVASIGGRMFSAGAQIISQLISGITSKIEGAISAVKGAISRVTSLLPGSPVKDGPLKVLNRGYAGGQIVKMLADGITRQKGLAARKMSDVVSGMNAELAALARTQAVGLSATVGVSSAMAGASGRFGGANAAAASSAPPGATSTPTRTDPIDYDRLAVAIVTAQKKSGLADDIGRSVGTVVVKGGRV